MNKNLEKADGLVVDCLPNGQFMVEIEDRTMRCYISGKMQQHKIKVLLNDKVIVVYPTGLSETVGRIIFRK